MTLGHTQTQTHTTTTTTAKTTTKQSQQHKQNSHAHTTHTHHRSLFWNVNGRVPEALHATEWEGEIERNRERRKRVCAKGIDTTFRQKTLTVARQMCSIGFLIQVHIAKNSQCFARSLFFMLLLMLMWDRYARSSWFLLAFLVPTMRILPDNICQFRHSIQNYRSARTHNVALKFWLSVSRSIPRAYKQTHTYTNECATCAVVVNKTMSLKINWMIWQLKPSRTGQQITHKNDHNKKTIQCNLTT